jgi:hypothetical protein
MTSSNTLKKLISIGAAMLLAVGGSLVATQPANATGFTIHWTSSDSNAVFALSSSSSYDQTNVSNNSTISAPTVTLTGCTVDRWEEMQNGSVFSFRTFPTSFYAIADTTYRAHWSCPPVLTTGPTLSVSGTTATAVPGVWARGYSGASGWRFCPSARSANSDMTTYFPSLCSNIYTSSSSMSSFATGTTLNFGNPLYVMGQLGLTAVTLSGQHLVYVEFADSTGYANSASVTLSSQSVVTPPTSHSNQSTPSLPVQTPAPAWQAPLLNVVPNLSKSLTTEGGKISLKDDAFATLKSVTVGGKAVIFTTGANGAVTIPVPAGKSGSADLTLTFDSGIITIQDGIKYVAPTVVADVVERPIAIAAGAKKLTEAVADQIRQAAFANMTNTTVQCVAYASKNTVAAKAAAKLTAIQACGIAAAANPALKVAEVSVIVNKAKAKKQAVGIKVYK